MFYNLYTNQRVLTGKHHLCGRLQKWGSAQSINRKLVEFFEYFVSFCQRRGIKFLKKLELTKNYISVAFRYLQLLEWAFYRLDGAPCKRQWSADPRTCECDQGLQMTQSRWHPKGRPSARVTLSLWKREIRHTQCAQGHDVKLELGCHPPRARMNGDGGRDRSFPGAFRGSVSRSPSVLGFGTSKLWDNTFLFMRLSYGSSTN